MKTQGNRAKEGIQKSQPCQHLGLDKFLGQPVCSTLQQL